MASLASPSLSINGIPTDVLEASLKNESWFKEQNINHGSIGDIQFRRSGVRLEPVIYVDPGDLKLFKEGNFASAFLAGIKTERRTQGLFEHG